MDDNWYSSDEDENGAPKSNLANIIKTLNQKPAAPPQPAPPSGVPFDIAKVLNVIQGVQPQPNQPRFVLLMLLFFTTLDKSCKFLFQIYDKIYS